MSRDGADDGVLPTEGVGQVVKGVVFGCRDLGGGGDVLPRPAGVSCDYRDIEVAGGEELLDDNMA